MIGDPLWSPPVRPIRLPGGPPPVDQVRRVAVILACIFVPIGWALATMP